MLETAAVPNNSITLEKYLLKCTSSQEASFKKIVSRLSRREPTGERGRVRAEVRRAKLDELIAEAQRIKWFPAEVVPEATAAVESA